jgi:hypothetical protein
VAMLPSASCPRLSHLDDFTAPGTDAFVRSPPMHLEALSQLLCQLVDECVLLHEACVSARDVYSLDFGVHLYVYPLLLAAQRRLRQRQYTAAEIVSAFFPAGWIGKYVCLGCNACGFTTTPSVEHVCLSRRSSPVAPVPRVNILVPTITNILGGQDLTSEEVVCELIGQLFRDRRELSYAHTAYLAASRILDDHNLIVTLETATMSHALALNFFSVGEVNQVWTCWRGCDVSPEMRPFHDCPRRAGHSGSRVLIPDPSTPGANWSH